ncbi:MAG: type Z 30S ribosomal protein S14 [Deltaproteobacteria bacterium CG07_land_8_20_14_0_80_38_7]|nr:MAG: type Z 30S ribosomal protein S14 [Deltaproteobacteria bacterium CG07_land_8_20_14_0_80_38_7]
MAKTCLRIKATRKNKFNVRAYHRCPRCGRSRAYFRKFDLCRLCFRQMALNGELPGVVKSSW